MILTHCVSSSVLVASHFVRSATADYSSFDFILGAMHRAIQKCVTFFVQLV